MTCKAPLSHRMGSPAIAALTASILLLAAAAPHAAAQTSYTVTDLGVLSGSVTSQPAVLNDAGTVAGTTTPIIRVAGHTVTSKGLGYHAFYWDSATRLITDIGTLSGGQSSSATDVNSLGEVVGSAATTSTGGNARAFYWRPSLGAGHLVALSQTLNNAVHSGTADTSSAAGINAAGVVAGYVYSAAWGTLPVYWQKDGAGAYQCIELPALVAGASSNSTGASQINAAGDIVGSLPDSNGTAHVVVWKNTGTPDAPIYGSPLDSGITDSWGGLINDGAPSQVAGNYNAAIGGGFFWVLGISTQDLGNLGYGNTRVYGLNNSGQVAGESWPAASGARHAFLWTPGGTDGVAWNPQMKDLGTVGGTQSWGRALNSSGVVVGVSQTQGDTNRHGFRWDNLGGIRDLNDSTLTPTKSGFSSLGEARKVSDLGYIVGLGTLQKGGYTHAYLLTPK